MKKKKCKSCSEYKDQDDMIKSNAGWFCNKESAYKYVNDQTKTGSGKKISIKKPRKDQRGVATKGLQQVFNKMVREREKLWFAKRGLHVSCVSCLKPLKDDEIQCGHRKSVGAYPELRFNRLNCFAQCGACNGSGVGASAYDDGLRVRFGNKMAEKIINAGVTRGGLFKLSNEQLNELRRKWQRLTANGISKRDKQTG